MKVASLPMSLRMGRGTVGAIMLAVMLTACPAVAAPAALAAGSPDDALVRAAQHRAGKRVMATEKRLRPGVYAYFTRGDRWRFSGPRGWASGYAPGALWLEYQRTAEDWWRTRALSRQQAIGAQQLTSDSLNVGALYYPTYALGHMLTGRDALKRKGLRAAGCTAARYSPSVGAMRSRPAAEFNVIIDSLMKLQLLWWGVKHGGPSGWDEIARDHALTTARDFIRPDGSTYHMVYYDEATGAVTRKAQSGGYSDESTWARGQAWAIHGFAVAYRNSGDLRLLDAARRVSDRYLADLPPDMIPYWDFHAPDIPAAPRDSSAAAIAASGLIDLALHDPDPALAERWELGARRILGSLMTPPYNSRGDDPAVLLHGTLSYWQDRVDCGTAYGDYFFLEALLRLRRLPPSSRALRVVRVRASEGEARAAVDRDPRTSWKSRGEAVLDLRLSATRDVAAVRLAMARGGSRAAKLRLLTSLDGVHWRLAGQTMTSGQTTGFETYTFSPRRALWVRVRCYGTTRGPVNAVAEAEVH
jgi:unsaturated chondroitin disaccharide hydrolase